MKIILIKDSKDGKANTIIDVSPGYGTNYLVRNKIGVPYNEKNYAELQRKLNKLVSDEYQTRQEAHDLKNKLENLVLKFELSANIDGNKNLNVHGSISTKDVEKEVSKLGFNVPKHAFQKIHLISEGKHDVEAILYKDIVAKIRIEIKINVHK
ncbi:50S ribosomal protein L9 [Mycoplasma sp. CSL7503-lung]|uniref:50S ribosomal protein L9 n=1 Tax=Mycoplasma sp. CSL7503-lung TaxID=536372 RepID=UPI0021D18C40|nr:50S ribosomal protein L9 [Mycoplasma sp. CSL7503-lung]MCU4706825.1 50S ribosomal protein L9 [Mycoplasma sp. CSL7503-lung]